jgi:HAD superfamily hydrolase (TIGR01458 family)
MEPGRRPVGLLLDVDGVFYVGDDPVPGAADVVAWAAAEGVPYRFVTNTTSHPRSYLVDKLARFGVPVTSDGILTPAVAARELLLREHPGPVALFVPSATEEEFAGLPVLDPADETGAGAVVVGDLGDRWDFATLNRAFRLLMGRPQPWLVSLGMTRYWRDSGGLHLDVGPFTRALEFAGGVTAVVTGKPAPAFFAAAARQLGLPASRVLMVGDDIQGDVRGAQQAGMTGLLVRTGKFRPADLDDGDPPDAVLDSVADLPAWWAAQTTVSPR